MAMVRMPPWAVVSGPEAARVLGLARRPLAGLAVGLCLGAVLYAVSPRTPAAQALIAPDGTMPADVQVRHVLSTQVLALAAEQPDLAADPALRQAPGVMDRLRAMAGFGAAAPGDGHAAALTRALSRAVTVRRSGPETLEITAVAPDQDKAMRMADAVARAAVLQAVEARATADRQAAQREATKLQTLHARLLEAEAKVAAVRRQRGDDPDIAGIRSAAAEARQRLEEAQKIGAAAKDLPDRFAAPGMEKIRAQLAEVLRTESALARTLGPKHPDMIQAQQQARTLRKALLDEARRTAEASKAELAAADAVELSAAARRAAAPPPPADVAGADLATLEAQVESHRAAYEAAMKAGKEEPPARGYARVLAPATAVNQGSSLTVLRALGFGGSLGMCFGALFAAIPDLRRRHAALSAAAAEDDGGTLAPAGADTAAAAAAPAPETAAREPMTVLVTSVETDAARTDLAIDLALRGVQDGFKVLLVDGQPRRRALTAAAVRLKRSNLEAPVRQVRLGGHWRPVLPLFGDGEGEAYLIPSGVTPSPAHPRLDDLSGFDIVMIDGPEAGPDAVPLGRQADRIVLADREGNIAPDLDGRVEALFKGMPAARATRAA